MTNHGSRMKNTHHLLFKDIALNQKQKNWSLDSPHQNNWKQQFSFNNLYAITHQSNIHSDKIIVPIENIY